LAFGNQVHKYLQYLVFSTVTEGKSLKLFDDLNIVTSEGAGIDSQSIFNQFGALTVSATPETFAKLCCIATMSLMCSIFFCKEGKVL